MENIFDDDFLDDLNLGSNKKNDDSNMRNAFASPPVIEESTNENSKL